jgi:hypothetical protein
MKKMKLGMCCLLFLAIGSMAQEIPDFSGTFVLTSLKGDHVAKTVPKTLWKVVQNTDSLEIVQTFEDGKTLASKYFLDGRESKNLTSGGVPTIDKIEIKGKTFVIRSSCRMLNGVPVHETQRWELSADSKTLKVRTQMQFEGMSVLDDTINETYQRQ